MLADELVPTLVNVGTLTELGTQVFMPWVQKLWDSPNVAHDNPEDQRFHASLILGFTDAKRRAVFFETAELAKLSGRLSACASAAHAYEVSAALTFVKDGQALEQYQQSLLPLVVKESP